MPSPEGRRVALVVAARAVSAVFFLMTGFYCLLTYSAFAYQQFIRPHLVAWLAEFIVWHHLGFWLVLAVTTLAMVRERLGARDRAIAWSYLAISTAAGVSLLVRPVLPQVDNNSRGLVLAFVALVPPVWLAVLDHRLTAGAAAPVPSPALRIAWSAPVAAAFVWLQQTAGVPWRLADTGEIALSSLGIVFGAATSFTTHLAVFAILALVAITAMRVGWRISGARGEHWALVALSAVTVTLVIQALVFGAISFWGRAAWGLSVALGLTIALVWSAIARRVHAAFGPSDATAIEVWLAPVPGVRSPLGSFAGLAVLAVLAFVARAQVATFDWDFLLQRLSALATWPFAFAYSFGVMATPAKASRRTLALAVSVVAAILLGERALADTRTARWAGQPPFVPEFALEGYATIDTSYRLIDGVLRVPSATDKAFYQHLRANSSIQHVDVAPVSVDFAQPLHASSARKPHIFLFVVDSLRPDYLSPYNSRVGFTPHMDAFAAESDVFERAFTRYGGTGLSVPSIWAGGMLLHKFYVKPFDPMNTLLKLLTAEGYELHMSMDPIVNDLIARRPSLVELDRDVPLVEFEMCGTLNELQRKLAARRSREQPIFVYSLPQNLHISHVRSKPVPPGASYPGFVAPVAAELQRLDACFGGFLAFLKREGLYEDSVIVVTSDHGDSLGESLRWGHSYTIFPEVARIPLIAHLPAWLRQGRTADRGAISFSTDITPTVYEFLGHSPADLGPLFGVSLFVRENVDVSWRRSRPFLIASSYGPVYGVLRENGTRLYIADGVNSRDYAYDLANTASARVGVTATDRAANRQFIREQIDELARMYRFRPQN